ncbi:MAG: YaeQ family protein [Polyangiaceae bacterium]
MALTATIYRWQVDLSDVDRAVYEKLDLRLARHPSESMRYLVTRALAYCLSYEEGIEFSKGGVSSTDEPPVSVRDATGLMTAWIDVGSPSVERIHKAAKACPRVRLFTTQELTLLRRAAEAGEIHRAHAVEVCSFEPSFIEALEALLDRQSDLTLTVTDGLLFVGVGAASLEAALERSTLVTLQ